MAKNNFAEYFTTEGGWPKYDENTGKALPPLQVAVERAGYRQTAAFSAVAAARELQSQTFLAHAINMAVEETQGVLDALNAWLDDLGEADS